MIGLRDRLTAAIRDVAQTQLQGGTRGAWGEAATGIAVVVEEVRLAAPALYALPGYEPVSSAAGHVVCSIDVIDPSPLLAALADRSLPIAPDVVADGDVCWAGSMTLTSWRDVQTELGVVALLGFDFDGGLVRRVVDDGLPDKLYSIVGAGAPQPQHVQQQP